MSYRLTFYSGFDRATEALSDDQINEVFDVLTAMTQEEGVRSGEIKIGRDLFVSILAEGDTLHVTDVTQRTPGRKAPPG